MLATAWAAYSCLLDHFSAKIFAESFQTVLLLMVELINSCLHHAFISDLAFLSFSPACLSLVHSSAKVY